MAKDKRCCVGAVRPSQLLWSYGPGALIDLPNISVLMTGIDQWRQNDCRAIDEQRLLTAVRRRLGPQVDRLLMPPISEETPSPFSPEAMIGAPVIPFPRWLRCSKCGLLAEYDSGLFELKEYPFRPEATHFVHKGCRYGERSDAVPARFLLACRNGHLDDFPWRWFVHKGPSDCKGTLRFSENGASLQTENLWVQCDCGARQQMAQAFGADAHEFLPGCRGRHPHLDRFEKCSEQPHTIILGASNEWFPTTLSVLALPTARDGLSQLVCEAWEHFKDAEDEAELKTILKTLHKMGRFKESDQWELSVIWAAIEKKRKDASQPPPKKTEAMRNEQVELKLPEWEVLTNPNPPTDWPHFLSHREKVPAGFEDKIENVLILDRLRQVNALTGFTRLESFDETDIDQEELEIASISRDKPEWVPACEVHGEGIFIRFKEDVLKKWEKNSAVLSREENLLLGYKGWRNSRHRNPGTGFPGARYIMLHTLAHIMIRELALSCGYNGSSIRERIYATCEPATAGILLYTASPDSDGTLGGLVELGKPEMLGTLLHRALSRAGICSSDPLCSKHNPMETRMTHAAACHACTFVSETSCEAGNKFLDRALLVKTCECADAAFFPCNGASK